MLNRRGLFYCVRGHWREPDDGPHHHRSSGRIFVQPSLGSCHRATRCRAYSRPRDLARRMEGDRRRGARLPLPPGADWGFAGTSPLGNAAPGPLLEQVAGEISRYIVDQRLVRPAIVGHSLGGLLALMTAARLRSAVSKAMIVDMVPFGAMLFKGPNVTAEEAVAIGARARERYFGANRQAATERLYSTMIRSDAFRAPYIDQAMSSDPDVSGRLFEEVALTDLRPQLKDITAPVTVLYVSAPNVPIGEDGTDALYRAAYRNLPHASLKRVPESYHFIMLDQPQRFAEEMREFLR